MFIKANQITVYPAVKIEGCLFDMETSTRLGEPQSSARPKPSHLALFGLRGAYVTGISPSSLSLSASGTLQFSTYAIDSLFKHLLWRTLVAEERWGLEGLEVH